MDAPPVHHGGSGGAGSGGKGGKSASGGTAVALGGGGASATPHAGTAGTDAEGGDSTVGSGGKNSAGGTGGKSSGGAGVAGGSAGSAGTVSSGGAPPAGALEVDYKCGNSSPTDNQIRSSLRVKSSADTSILLSTLELRYYFTSEVALPLTIEIYDASVDGTSGYHAISHDAVKAEVSGPVTDAYLKLTFTQAAGALSKGSALTLDVAVHGPNWTGNFSEADDYSFGPDHADFAAWDHVTLFGGGELSWGKEP